jgi:serine/threonine protein kinase
MAAVQREASLWALLSPPGAGGGHANVAAFYGLASVGQQLYLLVEACGEDHLGAHALRARLAAASAGAGGKGGGGLPSSEVHAIATDVASALCHVHDIGVVHGALALEALRRGADPRLTNHGSHCPPKRRRCPRPADRVALCGCR